MQVTASKVGLLLNCQRPFDPATPISREEPSEAMRYGSALHEALEHEGRKVDFEALAKKWKLPSQCAVELQQHAIRALRFLTDWMRKNQFEVKFQAVSRETHRATRFGKMRAPETRTCNFDVETHHYDLHKGEFGGTDDLLLVAGDIRIVLDYKSGDYGTWHSPASLPQMLTLALQTEATHVAILHTPREGVIQLYVEEVTKEALEEHASRLWSAMRRIGDGSLRPGDWCKRCPAREGCPSKDGELLTRSTNMLATIVKGAPLMPGDVDPGKLHMFLQEFERLAKRAREALREEVRSGAVIARPDGKVLRLKPQERESLSKASVVRALGKQKGEKMLTKLRDLGAIETSTIEMLVAEDE